MDQNSNKAETVIAVAVPSAPKKLGPCCVCK